MKFKIENERLRIRRHGERDYSFEIPEWDITKLGFLTAEDALESAIRSIKEGRFDGAEVDQLRAELDALVIREKEILATIKKVMNTGHPVTDLLEQEGLCRHAIGMLNYPEDQEWGTKVKMVGFYDQGDVDEDGDRDFIVSYTW